MTNYKTVAAGLLDIETDRLVVWDRVIVRVLVLGIVIAFRCFMSVRTTIKAVTAKLTHCLVKEIVDF